MKNSQGISINKYKDLKIEIEKEKKMLHPKTAAEIVIVGTMGMIKKVTDEHINKILASLSRCKMKKKCTLRNCSSHFDITINVNEKYDPKEAAKTKIHRIHKISDEISNQPQIYKQNK